MGITISEIKTIYSRHNSTIYTYLNIGFCALELITFGFGFGLIVTPKWFSSVRTAPFYMLLLTRYMMSWVLYFSHKQKKAKQCQAWCLFEAVMIVLILVLVLSRFVKLTRVGIVTACLSFMFKMYGLWVIYYFSLEVKYNIFVCFTKNFRRQQISNSKPDSNPLIAQGNDGNDGRVQDLLETRQLKDDMKQDEDNSNVQYSVIYM